MQSVMSPESRHLSPFASSRLLAHDLVPTHIEVNGLVHPTLPRGRYSVADSHYVSAADRLACLRLLCGRRFGRGSKPRNIYSAAFRLRRAARIRARIRDESFRDYHTRHHVASHRWSRATGTDAGRTSTGTDHRGGRANG